MKISFTTVFFLANKPTIAIVQSFCNRGVYMKGIFMFFPMILVPDALNPMFVFIYRRINRTVAHSGAGQTLIGKIPLVFLFIVMVTIGALVYFFAFFINQGSEHMSFFKNIAFDKIPVRALYDLFYNLC